MGGSIGAIQLDDPLYWVTKHQQTMLGCEKRALDGSIVQTWVTGTSKGDHKHIFRFTWITGAQLDSIKALIATRNSFNVKCTESSAAKGPCRFLLEEPLEYKPVPPEEFFSQEEVSGTPLDLYNGEIRVWLRT